MDAVERRAGLLADAGAAVPADHLVHRVQRCMVCSAATSGLVVVALILTSWQQPGHIGAPQYWPWVLTGLQVTALWGAGAHRAWGWPLGAAIQPPWIAYAVLTGQLGFIPGCLVSMCVQTVSALRRAAPAGPEQAPTITTPEHRRT